MKNQNKLQKKSKGQQLYNLKISKARDSLNTYEKEASFTQKEKRHGTGKKSQNPKHW